MSYDGDGWVPEDFYTLIGRVQAADLAEHEKALVEERRARQALFVAQGGSLTASDLLGVIVKDADPTSGLDDERAKIEAQEARRQEAVRAAAAKKAGRFPPPPTGGFK